MYVGPLVTLNEYVTPKWSSAQAKEAASMAIVEIFKVEPGKRADKLQFDQKSRRPASVHSLIDVISVDSTDTERRKVSVEKRSIDGH